MEVIPLHADFGAEIKGANLLDIICSERLQREVRAAFDEHSVLLWRGQEVSDDIQATFARGFGALERTKVGSSGAGTFYSRLNNIAPDGSVAPPTDRSMLIAKANQLWHTDSSFKQQPALASVLSARVIPTDGGGTEFVSTRVAWEKLPESRKAALLELDAIHSYATSRDQIDPGMMSAQERALLPAVQWRLTWRNPVNGRRSLYIASHVGGIAGLPDAEARALVQELMDHATQVERRYVHSWQPGDVIIWDNRATMHRGRPWKGGEPRSIVRVTISASETDGLESILPRVVSAKIAPEPQNA